ncbi:hypothetical protein BBJ29_010151, partial [Phytophthora kernoviae]
MTPNHYNQEVRTPAVEDAQYHDDTGLRMNVSTPDTDNKKDDDVRMDKNGRPLVKFFRWHMTRMQRILIIVGVVVLFIVVVLLIIFLVIIPALIQHYMDKVVLHVNYMDVTSIPSDTTIAVNFSVNIQHDVPVSATTDDITAYLTYSGVEFGYVTIPSLDIKSGKQNYNLTMQTTMVISDTDGFNEMAAAMMEEAEVSLDSTAEVDAHALNLPFNNLKFERTLDLVGFDQFKDLDPEFDGIDWWGCSDDVYDMDINVTINNPSAMGLEGIGMLNLSIYFEDNYVGYAYSLKPELGMPRGRNMQYFRAVMEQNTVGFTNMTMAVIGGSATINILGDNPYATEYEQFKEALSKVNMTVDYTNGLNNVTFNASCVTGL